MIAQPYESPPTRLQIDAAESRHGDGRAGFLLPRVGSAASSIAAPAPGAPTTAVEQHGAGGAVRPTVPPVPEYVPASAVTLIEPDGRVWWAVGR